MTAISEAKFRDEHSLVAELIGLYPEAALQAADTEGRAAALVEAVRARKDEQPLLDAFLKEFGLNNQEGIALMCLAESLLRVPDGQTADELIADKVATAHWDDHQGRADSLFVNASTWALMLTGQVISLDRHLTVNPGSWFEALTGRLGAPVVRTAMTRAMRIMGAEFVLGRSIEEAAARGHRELGGKAAFSFDMLGEGARDRTTAGRYQAAYAEAIDKVAKMNRTTPEAAPSSVSIKLSALHPRYGHIQRERVLSELYPTLAGLCRLAAENDVAITIDAEEADRLALSLELFERLAADPALAGWQGLGMVVQAYGKRALPVLRWLETLAAGTGHRFPVRLVKGAYWDAEIKHAQEQGYPDFPVFTRKEATDLSYLVCAQEVLAHPEAFYGQFATHNAHTLTAVLALAGSNRDFEFQRLHGMGELLYRVAREREPDFPALRVYAPVGSHEDLLAYLVRRLLENGANSSFVNRFMDAGVPAREIVRDPAARLAGGPTLRNPAIPLPGGLFGAERANSAGVDLSDASTAAEIARAIGDSRLQPIAARPLVPGSSTAGEPRRIVSPADPSDQPGSVVCAHHEDAATALALAAGNQGSWDRLGGEARAAVLDRAADLLSADITGLIALIVREAGRTWADAVDEVREAVDFLRYYAVQARTHFQSPVNLPGPAGEENTLSLHGRGTFLCISPWNFPLAIFTGQVAAALAAGNAVLAKPAEQTPLVAFQAIRMLHRAGVPETVLHYLPGNASLGSHLVSLPGIAGVAFTGGTDTARRINQALATKPGPIVPLVAETGGQNVMIVDSTALLEQVTDDVIRSAFASAGQRCSSLRVLYLQEEIAEDALALIRGAMAELTVGNPASMSTDLGPIIDREALAALRGHVMAMRGAGYAVHTPPVQPPEGLYLAPHLIEIDRIGRLKTEHFGPILHVIRFAAAELERHLQEAFDTGFGLTFGVHSRIERRAEALFARAPVGNTYVNRNMVGAVVGVQPFGGQGLSGTGPKAGGPHYLFRFATEKTLSVNTMATGGNAELLSL